MKELFSLPERPDYIYEIGDSFEITGFLYNTNIRFKTIKTENLMQALCINLWRGSVWLVRNGKKSLIKRVQN